MIVFDNVTLRYHYDEYDLLKGVSFSLTEGVNTVLADTQSGKTSICKLLTKQVSPTSGLITVNGADICSITNANLDILYLSRNPTFFQNRSMLYNIAYPLRVRKVPKQVRNQIAQEVATKLHLDNIQRKVKSLDSGQRQLLALARGLTVKRQTVLFDDFFNLDDGLQQIQQTLALFEGANCVLLTSESDLALGNVVVLDGGKVVYQGDASDAKQVVSKLGWLTHNLRSI